VALVPVLALLGDHLPIAAATLPRRFTDVLQQAEGLNFADFWRIASIDFESIGSQH